MKGYLFQVSGICKNIVIFWVDLIEKSRKTNTRISRLRQSQQNGRMEKPESGIRSRKRNPNPNPNLRNKNWRRFCLESVTNYNCSIKTFHHHIIFIYCYYIFYCRIFAYGANFSSRISYTRERCNLGSWLTWVLLLPLRPFPHNGWNTEPFYSGYHQHAPSRSFFFDSHLRFRGRQSTVTMVFHALA